LRQAVRIHRAVLQRDDAEEQVPLGVHRYLTIGTDRVGAPQDSRSHPGTLSCQNPDSPSRTIQPSCFVAGGATAKAVAGRTLPIHPSMFRWASLTDLSRFE